MKKLFYILFVLLIYLQYRLWVDDDSLIDVWQAGQEIEVQQQENAGLRERNDALDAEVQDLKQGLEAIEERAREDLGMIKEDETFYQVVE